MARAFTLLLLAGMLGLPVRAQTDANSAAASPPLDPAKIADYHRRFEEGQALEKDGKLEEARAVFDGILAEQPEAKGSLLEEGEISLELNDPLKADAYLDKLHALVPNFPGAIVLMIQANETLKKDVKVERLVRELRALHASGTAPGGFSDSLLFDREHIRLDAGEEIVISEFFDYTKPPYNAFMAELTDPVRHIHRKLYLNYDPVGTQTVRAKDPKLARDEVFILAEPVVADKGSRIDVYQLLSSMPDYDKVRSLLLLTLTQTPKPIYSSPIDTSAQ